jgi:hypothetical protein
MGEALPADRRGAHLQRSDTNSLGLRNPIGKAIDPPLVHQEADRAAVHPEDGHAGTVAVEHLVKRFEHEAVAAQGDEHLRSVRIGEGETPPKHRFRRLCDIGMRGEQPDAPASQVDWRLALPLRSVRGQTLLPKPFPARAR